MKETFSHSGLALNAIHLFSQLISFTSVKLTKTFADLLGVNEAVATADIGYFYSAVSVGGESG